jgi:hypothetical protein
VCLGSVNLNLFSIFILFFALTETLFMWSSHVNLLLKVNPRLVCVVTSCIGLLLNKIGSRLGLGCLLDILRKYVLSGLKVTLYCVAHCRILCRSLLIFWMESYGEVIVSSKVVSSANKLTCVCSELGRSFIKSKNSNGPSIEP